MPSSHWSLFSRSPRPRPAEPSWTVMPLAGTPEARSAPWPSANVSSGHWFWEYYRAGCHHTPSMTSSPGNGTQVFWVNTKAILGSDCCAVARDISSPEGPLLRHGRYVYFQVLQAGNPVPSLEALLADSGKIDLAPRFRICPYRAMWLVPSHRFWWGFFCGCR